MKRFFLIASVLTAFVAAFVLYALKLDTRRLAERANSLGERIEHLNAAIAIEEAELANLSRPHRLEPLATRFTKLQPVEPSQLGAIAEIPLRSELAGGDAQSSPPVGSANTPELPIDLLTGSAP